MSPIGRIVSGSKAVVEQVQRVPSPQIFILMLIALLTFIAFRLASTYQLETKMANLEAVVKDGQQKSDVLDQVQMQTLGELSQTVYGELQSQHKDPKTVRVVTTVPLIRHERMMQEMMMRIQQLERSRLELQGQNRRLEDRLRKLENQ